MSKTRIYYKVCFRSPSQELTSACRNFEFPDEFIVTYRVGEWISPQIEKTRLFIFSTLTAARIFQNTLSGERHVIFECEAKNVSVPKFIPSPAEAWAFWKKKWARKKLMGSGIYFQETPIGSRTASEIKLIREVR